MKTVEQSNRKFVARPSALSRLAADQRGAASVEYIIIAGLIAIACIAAFREFGTAVSTKVGEQAGTIGTIPGTE